MQSFPASDVSGGVCATHTGVAGSRGYDIVLTANQTITGRDFGNDPNGPLPPPPGNPPKVPTLDDLALLALAALLDLSGAFRPQRRRLRAPSRQRR